MEKTTITKLRILKVLDIFQKHSDEHHLISLNFVLEELENYGIICSKYALYDDINNLNDFGYDIIYQRNLGYYLNHQFDIAELKILVDALAASSFLSSTKTEQLINKLLAANSKYQTDSLKNNLNYTPTKTKDDRIIYNIANLLKSIHDNYSISFLYFDLDITKTKKYRRQKRAYDLIPYALIWHNQFYYCIGYSVKYQAFQHYRIDKMEDINFIKPEVKLPFNCSEYTSRFIDMYIKEKTNVTMKCSNHLANIIFDKFSQDIMIVEILEDHFIFNINIDPSITFISWLVMFKTDIEVIKPQSLIDDIGAVLRPIIDMYS